MASKPAKSRSISRLPGFSSIVILFPLLTPPTLVQLNLVFLVPTFGFSTSALCTFYWQVRSPLLQVYILHWLELVVSQVCEGPFGFRSFAEAGPSTWNAPLFPQFPTLTSGHHPLKGQFPLIPLLLCCTATMINPVYLPDEAAEFMRMGQVSDSAYHCYPRA